MHAQLIAYFKYIGQGNSLDDIIEFGTKLLILCKGTFTINLFRSGISLVKIDVRHTKGVSEPDLTEGQFKAIISGVEAECSKEEPLTIHPTWNTNSYAFTNMIESAIRASIHVSDQVSLNTSKVKVSSRDVFIKV